jgi:hypothetical protein
MDFLPKRANLQGGGTRKAPKNTQFSKSRHTPEGKGPSPPRHPLNLSQIQIPIGLNATRGGRMLVLRYQETIQILVREPLVHEALRL